MTQDEYKQISDHLKSNGCTVFYFEDKDGSRIGSDYYNFLYFWNGKYVGYVESPLGAFRVSTMYKPHHVYGSSCECDDCHGLSIWGVIERTPNCLGKFPDWFPGERHVSFYSGIADYTKNCIFKNEKLIIEE